ncbi:unnamed protein product [Colias eurytheme]|nr:unnamed protein product [Colias eurytheme]
MWAYIVAASRGDPHLPDRPRRTTDDIVNDTTCKIHRCREGKVFMLPSSSGRYTGPYPGPSTTGPRMQEQKPSKYATKKSLSLPTSPLRVTRPRADVRLEEGVYPTLEVGSSSKIHGLQLSRNFQSELQFTSTTKT